MKELLLSVMTISLFAGGIQLLTSEGKLKKQMAFVTALVLCAALFTPVMKQMGKEITFDLSLPAVAPIDSGEAEAAILRMTTEALCRELEAEVAYRFAIEAPALTLTLDGRDPTAVEILSGHLRGSGEVTEAAIYLSTLLRCPITAESIPQEETS
jgi:hypothetical protein